MDDTIVGRLLGSLGHFLEANEHSITAGSALALAVITLWLVFYTRRLWASTGALVRGADETIKKQLVHDREVNRAYFTGGGECFRDSSGWPSLQNGHRLFRFEVGNHGKTPAFMYEYALQFATLDEVCRTNIPFEPRTLVDQFPPGERSRPTGESVRIIRSETDVAFGAVWYKDIWGEDHYSRFILRIANDGQTHSNVPGIDSAYYRKWT